MLRQIKKAVLQDPIVLAAPMQTRLEKRPFTQTILSPTGFKLSTVQKVALGILMVPPALGFVFSLLTGQWTFLFITGILLLLVGLMVWVIKLRSQMAWIVTWNYDSVEVQDGRYGKFDHWIEPLSAFTGLKKDFGVLPRGGQYGPNKKAHGLLLVHPDPSKNILLHADTKPISDQTVTYYRMKLKHQLIR
ncbi:MAG: hypothetical protein DWQ04_30665 [Chloroflexi bacterium]|nr:MAG: hypothetical protein DWQ04_30665 [Chloroflexota bacterium]